MSADSRLHALRDNLAPVVSDVLRAMIGLETVEVAAPVAAPAETFTAAIFFAGDWLGAVLLECPPAVAFNLTRRLMRIPEPSAFDDDVRDTLGELANMIAGNLKAVLPPGTALSMPTVVSGRDYALQICGIEEMRAAWFAGPGVAFRVSMMELGDRRDRPRS